MKYKILIPIICLMSLSCGEGVGSGDYYFTNSSSIPLYFHILDQDETYLLLSGESQLLAEDVSGGIGVAGLPSDYIQSLYIYNDIHLLNQVYAQDPIDDDRWQRETPSGYDYWEYAIFTFEITDAMLVP
ncbi:MAG: hypothetical protein ABUK01_11010 [Leptospirales bacterium]